MIIPLLPEAPPAKIRGGYRAFSQGVQQAATGGQFSYAGCRVQAPFGALITAGFMLNTTANITTDYRFGVKLFPTVPTWTPAIYRDQPTLRALQDAAKGTTLFGAGSNAAAPGGFLFGLTRPATLTVLHPIMCIVPKDWDFLLVHETVNITLITTLFGVEFLTAEAMTWFRDRMV